MNRNLLKVLGAIVILIAMLSLSNVFANASDIKVIIDNAVEVMKEIEPTYAITASWSSRKCNPEVCRELIGKHSLLHFFVPLYTGICFFN